ncbi:MAG: hypothetical protein CVV10_08250 [Gammaproteobacteria bacterium HGW-Gammaproteobacteria-14]|nr:MAG: hypothetical protein CVV10_08250 [Gammaproteobacteria bacterium HGW-Gammaproteobacteria-14]
MTDQRKPSDKPPLAKTPPKALLDELNSIHSLLGEASKDVPSTPLDADIPLLPPVDNPQDPQISLLDGAPPLRRALAERENPFLPKRPADTSRTVASQPPTATKPAASPQGKTDVTPDTPPDSAQIRALVDETLAEWLPKIERDLRARLTEWLKEQKR